METDKRKRLPKEYAHRRYYIPEDVAKHSTPNDFWVSFYNKVFDLTRLLDNNVGNPLCDPIVRVGGTDITHWYDVGLKYRKTNVNPTTTATETFCP